LSSSGRDNAFTLFSVLLLLTVLFSFSRFGSEYQIRILSLVGIFISLAVSYNLVNGVTGSFPWPPTPSSPWGRIPPPCRPCPWKKKRFLLSSCP